MQEFKSLIGQHDDQISKVERVRYELPDWAKDFDLDPRTGKPLFSPDNIKKTLLYHDYYKGKIRYNVYRNNLELDGQALTDDLLGLTRNNLYRLFNNPVNRSTLDDVLGELRLTPEISYHPVKEYFDSLIWDGISRLDTMLIDWFKAEDNILNREISKKWMLGAVKRILNPGCKFDSVLMLTGGTGIGKSTFCERLPKGFGYVNLNEKDLSDPTKYVPILNDNWIIGLDERGALSKKDQNFLKTFFTSQTDTTRPVYERYARTFKRHCIFIGTTNDKQFLNDYSVREERRYWIVKCNLEDTEYIYENFTDDIIDQLWAEAYQLYIQDPEQKLILSKEAYELFKKDQKQYKTLDNDNAYIILEDKLNNTKYAKDNFDSCEEFYTYLTQTVSYNAASNSKKLLDKIPLAYINYYISKEKIGISGNKLTSILEDLGFEKKKTSYKRDGEYVSTNCYVRKEENQELPIETTSL